MSAVEDTTPARYRMLAFRTNATKPVGVVARALWRYETEPWVGRGELAAEAGISEPQLLRWVQLADIPRRRRAPLPPSPDSIAKAVDAFDRHGSVLAAAEHTGMGPKAITLRLGLAGRAVDEDRPDTISRRLLETWAVDDGWMSTADAAIVVGWSRTYVCHQAARGKIPGAERRPGPNGTRPVWHIPRAWADSHRSDTAPSAKAAGVKEWLPAGPLVAWIEQTGRSSEELSGGVDAQARALRRLVTGEQVTAELGWADAFLLKHDMRLEDVWPDIDAALTVGHSLRFDRVHRFNNARKHQQTLNRIRAEIQSEERAA